MIELPDTTSISRIADWIELYLLVYNKHLSKNKIISLFQRTVTGDFDESLIDGAFTELNRRLFLYGRITPFEIKGNIAIPHFTWRKFPQHTMCVIFSTYGAANSDGGTKLFERLAESCLNHYLGSKSTLFGFPSNLSFTEQVDNFAKLCFEKREDDPAPFDKDRGLDIIAWKSFDDRRKSQFYYLVQCAAGGWWRDKKPIPINSWRRYIAWNNDTTIPIMAITQIVEAEKWQNAIDDYGVIVDRARFYRTITSSSYKMNASLKTTIKNWCQRKIV